MTIHAYNQIYLDRCSYNIGFMLHNATVVYGHDGSDFLNRFIQSGIAEEIEEGNPKYITGKSGIELYKEVMEKTTKNVVEIIENECLERTPEFWIGWILAHYQWYSGHSFKSILEIIPYEKIDFLYETLHEMDISKSYELFDKYFDSAPCRLKTIRLKCNLTQQELADKANVSINTIRAFERKSKDLNKAQFDIIGKLAKALRCNEKDLVY